MRQKTLYILGLLGALLLGALVTRGIQYLDPITIETIKENKNVTITDTGLSEAVGKVYDSVVVVHVETKRSSGFGSGFVYKVDDDNAYVLTNHHVIDNANNITVEFMDDVEVKATVVGSDVYADIAVLKIEKVDGIKAVELGKSEDMKLGDTVFAIGTPIDLSYKGTVTRGIVSGLNRLVSISIESNYTDDYIMKAIQIDAPINSGNSGGPLCNANGEVIGVNTMKIASSTTENIGFSIPIEDALDYAKEITEKGKVERPYLGIAVYELSAAKYIIGFDLKIDDDVEGIYIDSVAKNSPAEKAGLKQGDVLVKLGDYDVTSMSEFRYTLYKYKPKDKVKVEVIRDGKTKTFTVELELGD